MEWAKKIIFLGIFWAFGSCTTVEEIDIGLNPPKLILNALFNKDSIWRISMDETINIPDYGVGNRYLYYLPNVIVTIYDSKNDLVEVLKPNGWLEYIGQTKPLPGLIYKVVVTLDRGGEIQATNYIPKLVAITSYKVDSSTFKSNGGDIQMTVSFQDPAAQKNFYVVQLVRNAYFINNNDTVRYLEDVYYKPINPLYQSNFANGASTILNDNLFDGKEYDFFLTVNPNFNSGFTEELRILLLNVTEEYYQYFITKNLQDKTSGDPFAQPTQIFSNIENGLGIFAGYSVSTIKIK